MDEYKGILDAINKANVATFDPRGFTIADMGRIMKEQDSLPRRSFNILVSGYAKAVLENDTERIAYYKREGNYIGVGTKAVQKT